MLLKIKIKDIHDVCGSVWLATAILTYDKYLKIQQQGKKYNYEDFAFKQSEIQKMADEICSKTVHNARISQWCNADHVNNTYNYLREVGKDRRLTIFGECHEKNEIPYNLLRSDEVIFEVPSLGQTVTFSNLINWIKIDFPALTNLKPLMIDEKRKIAPHTPKIKNKIIPSWTYDRQQANIVPSARDLLRSLPINLSKIILQTTFWVKKDIFDFITQNNRVVAPGVFYPYTIRKQGSELQGSKPQWKEITEGKRFLDLNHKAQNALSYSLIGKSFQAAFSDYACCHIYGRKYTHDWKCFTCVGNIILVPKSLQSLTDHDEEITNCLKQIAYLKYGWKPDDQEIIIDEKTKDLLNLTNEIGISLESFKTIRDNELDKHRKSFRKKFNADPDF